MFFKTALALTMALGLCSAQEPDKTRPSGQQPDNTRKNQRDRSDATMTADKQSNDKKDLELVRMIRSDINKSEMSTYAKNVKVITNGGRVVLRGPVNSQEEKTAIEAIAKKHAAGGNVDNQLEVKVAKP